MPNEKFPMALPEGAVLAGQFIIEEVLGQGGFGITYRAKDHKTGDTVAVKEYFPDTMVSRTETTVVPFTGEREENFKYGLDCFLREAETLAKYVDNEGIVSIRSYFEENGTAYFVMDFVDGVSFDQYIKDKGDKIDFEDAKNVLLPIMDALGAVHKDGIVHRDVTPDNIYITKDGSIKLLDFGAARYSIGDKSRSLDVVLKHGYAPKEQYTRHGKQGPFTDIYTVGVCFYRAITGKLPTDSIDRLDEDDVVLPSTLGVKIEPHEEEAILKAMAIQPADRFKSMEEFKTTLLGEDNAPVKEETKGEALVEEIKNATSDKKHDEKHENKKVFVKRMNIPALVVILIMFVCTVLPEIMPMNNPLNYGVMWASYSNDIPVFCMITSYVLGLIGGLFGLDKIILLSGLIGLYPAIDMFFVEGEIRYLMERVLLSDLPRRVIYRLSPLGLIILYSLTMILIGLICILKRRKNDNKSNL